MFKRTIVSKHAIGRIYKRLALLGIKNVNIRRYIEQMKNFARSLTEKYIVQPRKFSNIEWQHGFLDMVIQDNIKRGVRVVITVIF